jgi:hypothetical protein
MHKMFVRFVLPLFLLTVSCGTPANAPEQATDVLVAATATKEVPLTEPSVTASPVPAAEVDVVIQNMIGDGIISVYFYREGWATNPNDEGISFFDISYADQWTDKTEYTFPQLEPGYYEVLVQIASEEDSAIIPIEVSHENNHFVITADMYEEGKVLSEQRFAEYYAAETAMPSGDNSYQVTLVDCKEYVSKVGKVEIINNTGYTVDSLTISYADYTVNTAYNLMDWNAGSCFLGYQLNKNTTYSIDFQVESEGMYGWHEFQYSTGLKVELLPDMLFKP